MDSIIMRLAGNMSAETKAELEALEATISDGKGKAKLHSVMDDNYVRLVRRKGQERVDEIKRLIKGVAAIYNEGTKHLDNPYIETVRRAVVAIDPKTMQVVAEYEGIRVAWKKTGLYHGTIQECCKKRHQMLMGEPSRKGYNTGAGKIWMYKEDWELLQSQQQEKPEV